MRNRPKTLTDEQRKLVAIEVVRDLISHGHLPASRHAAAVEDIARYARRRMDGFEIARALETNAYWLCDLEMAQCLDGFSWAWDKQFTAAEKAWFDAERPEPPVGVGQHVWFRHGPKDSTGVVDEIYQHGVAKFLVKIDGDPDADGPRQSRAIVNWEDVTSLDDQQ